MTLKKAFLIIPIGIITGCGLDNPDRNYVGYVYSTTQHHFYISGKIVLDTTYLDNEGSGTIVWISHDGNFVKTSYSSRCINAFEYIVKKEKDTNFAYYSDPTIGISTYNWIAFKTAEFALEKSRSNLTRRGCFQLDTVNSKLYHSSIFCDTSLPFSIIDSIILFNKYYPDASMSRIPDACK